MQGATIQTPSTTQSNRQRCLEELQGLVQISSLTGEEFAGQVAIGVLLSKSGAKVERTDVDLKALFTCFPSIAQYPTHWKHDLILPYDQLPNIVALEASGLEKVLNYNGRPNIIGRWNGTGGGRSLILNGHIDTVTIEPRNEWTNDPFGAEIIGDLMYGRGTSDMKGGIVAAIMAMTILKESGVDIKGDVIFQSVVNEEHSGNGTLDLVRRGITADAAIVLEPTNNRIMTSHPGALYWKMIVPGKQRSPGARWKNGVKQGVSAIENLVPVINALLNLERSYNKKYTRFWSKTSAAPFSLVVGQVNGGHYDTATAGSAIIRGSAYFSPALGSVSDIMEQFRKIADVIANADPFFQSNPICVEFLHHDDGTQQSPQIPLAVELGIILTQAGLDPEVTPGIFACDMRHLVNRGVIPSVIFGPGDISQAHKPDEFISISEFLKFIDILIEFIPAWCNGAIKKGE